MSNTESDDVVAVSVVLATLGRPQLAASVVGQLLEQLGCNDEIVVVDQSDGMDARDLRNALAVVDDVRVQLVVAAPGLPAARNVGVDASSRDVVLFVDDDVVLGPGFVAAHKTAYADPTIGAVGGRIHERVLTNNATALCNRIDLWGRIVTNLDVGRDGTLDTLKGANMSFRRQALTQAGCFDTSYAGTSLLEDADMSTRVAARGWQIRFAAKAVLDHLSAPRGGVRQDAPSQAVRWRIHNTALYVATHRGAGHALPLACGMLVVAVRSAWAARNAFGLFGDAATFVRGWRLGRHKRADRQRCGPKRGDRIAEPVDA